MADPLKKAFLLKYKEISFFIICPDYSRFTFDFPVKKEVGLKYEEFHNGGYFGDFN